jgi:biopolymer transport protein ExbD
MNLRKRHRITAEVSTSSLNDIMFFLLLFFLIVSTLVSPNVIKLLLPNASSGKAVSKGTITLSVNQDIQYFIDNKPFPYESIEPTLSQKAQGIDELTVLLKVDKTLPVQNLVDLLDIGNRLKIKMVLATQAPQN